MVNQFDEIFFSQRQFLNLQKILGSDVPSVLEVRYSQKGLKLNKMLRKTRKVF